MKAITKLTSAAMFGAAAPGASSVTLAGVAARAGPFEGMDKKQRLPPAGQR